jgi:hypothetical protein
MFAPSLVLSLVLTLDAAAPQECLRRYQTRQQRLDNAVMKSIWEDFRNGNPVRRDYQTQIIDSLNRWRLKMASEQYSDGKWIRHDETPYEWDVVYDGEITANIVFEPGKNRVGKEPGTGDAKGYRVAQIYGYDWEGLKDQRTPLTFCDPYFNALQSAISNRQPIQVAEISGDRIEIVFPADQRAQFYRFEIDVGRDWIPVLLSVQSEQGIPSSLTMLEYAETDSGVLYIKSGVHQSFTSSSQDARPLHETRFKITDAQINDPGFSDAMFEIVLTDDTLVQDMRYQAVSYRIGEERVVTQQLAALSQAALDAAHRSGQLPRRRDWMWLMWFNAVLVAVLSVWFFLRRAFLKKAY